MDEREKVLSRLSVLEKSPPNVPGDPKIVDMILEYVAKNKLIVYGGIAIDTYLRKIGQRGIYKEDEDPDIDIYTPDVVRDMYTITNMVYNMGTHRFVETIPSRTHQHSRRVRYEFGPNVIDLTPIGSDLFKSLPTFTSKFRGHTIRFIDLPVIKMNLYFALSINPLQNSFRLKKDFERLVHVRGTVAGKKSGGAKSDVWEIEYNTPKLPRVSFSEDPLSEIRRRNIKVYHEYSQFLDFPGYVSFTEDKVTREIYFFPENFIFMPRNIYGQLYFFHVKLIECMCATDERRKMIDEYSRAIKHLENSAGDFSLDVTPMLPKFPPVRQLTTSTQTSFDRIYRPEKKFKELKRGEPIKGISGEKIK